MGGKNACENNQQSLFSPYIYYTLKVEFEIQDYPFLSYPSNPPFFYFVLFSIPPPLFPPPNVHTTINL